MHTCKRHRSLVQSLGDLDLSEVLPVDGNTQIVGKIKGFELVPSNTRDDLPIIVLDDEPEPTPAQAPVPVS